jgi:hypothetical protein
VSVALAALVVSLAAGVTSAGATPVPTAAAPLTLVSQTPWVGPGDTFDLKVMPGATTGSAAALGLSVSVYTCLSSVSAFDQSVASASGPAGTPIDATTAPLPLSGLPVTAGGVYDLSMPVHVGRGVTAPAGGFTIDLAASSGQCADYPSGVYPVRVQLVDTSSGQVVGSFTTHLVFAEATTGTERLKVAVVLPIATTLGAAHDPGTGPLATQPSSALAPPSPADTAAVTATVAAISAGQRQAVPITLDASPQTLQSLGATGHETTLDQLATLADTPSIHQFAVAPFVPVNAAGLVGAGLGSELGLQVARGAQVMAAKLPETTSAAPVSPTNGGLGAWFTNDGLDTAAVAQLQADGYRQMIVPASSVPGAPVDDSAVEPFQLTTGPGSSVMAVAASADLADRFTADPGDPALGASQLAAELAQIYYEKPNDTKPRIVAVMAPTGWTDDPTFVGTLLDALDQNQIVQAVTTTDLFAALPPSPCRGACRTVAGPGASGLPVAAIRTQRHRVAALGTAATTTAAQRITTQLGDLVLAGQSERLRPAGQAGVLRNAGLAVDAQLNRLQVARDQSITLTAQKGRVPVTITSDAPYPVTGTLTLTSDKLTFPKGQSQRVTVVPGITNPYYFNVQTRASGLFKVDVALSSPAGGLTLATGQVSVRSTATSVVGVVLSLGALAVLLVWWLRTSRRRRVQRRAEEAGDGGDSAVRPGPPVPADPA